MPSTRGTYIFLRYCPPTSYKACVICPSEQYFTVSINSAKKLPLLMATSFNRFKASSLLLHCVSRMHAGFAICCSFSSLVLRITSLGIMVGLPFLLRKVFTPMIGNSPVCFRVFVIQAFFLYLISLIHSFHGAQALRLFR